MTHHLRLWLNLVLPLLQPLAGGLHGLTGIGHSIAAMSASSETPVTPSGYAFIIWAPLFLLSIVWGIWQALPMGRDSGPARYLGWPLAGVFAANILWMLLAQTTGNGWHLVVVILIGLGCALVAFWMERGIESGRPARWWIAAPLAGLLAGWLTAASFANIAGAARAVGFFPAEGIGASLAAVLIILAAGGFAAGMLAVVRQGWWYAAGIGWALVAIVWANTVSRSFDLLTAGAALLMLAVVAVISWRQSQFPSRSPLRAGP
jgi:hypothetical protein